LDGRYTPEPGEGGFEPSVDHGPREAQDRGDFQHRECLWHVDAEASQEQ